LVIEDSRTNESGNEGSEHLAAEGDPGWNVDVMSELEILSEVEGMRRGDVSVDLEVVHGIDITGEPETTEQLGKNVEGHLRISDGLDYTARNTKDDGE